MAKTEMSNSRIKKILLFLVLFVITLIILLLFYLSNYGFKTSQFNKIISEKLTEIDPNISVKIDDVFVKLN